jgi:S1-C subfamily serine protease
MDSGPPHPATPIWFDAKNDLALLRVPGVRGMPALALASDPQSGTAAAMLGFPGGHWADRPARLGATSSLNLRRMNVSMLPREFSSKLFGRPITSFAGRSEPGSSGGPLVDSQGRVLTTVFGGDAGNYSGVGVPDAFVRRALRSAGPPVATGSCATSLKSSG